MSIGIRRNIAKKIADLAAVESNSKIHLINNLPAWFELKRSKDNNDIELHLPVIKTRNLLENYGATTIKKIINATNLDNDRFIKAVSMLNEESFIFKLNKNAFIRETLQEYHSNKDMKNFYVDLENNKNIIIEFSSPNVAKPFHVGHLRSTIIGNFIANLQKYLGNNVVKLNYLGDWGTQFGFLQIGVEMLEVNDEEMKKNPIQNLYNAYVTANKAARNDPNIIEAARKAFASLESGSSSINEKQKWEKYREYTVLELKEIYQRLGVEFDEYAWESQYNQRQIQNVVELLEQKKLLSDEVDGRKIAQIGNRRVPVIKSDGSTLYLARDIAALLDRFKRYKFDKHLYVVDNAQTDHFHALFHIVENLEERLQNKIKHIKFGRIKGMSTRSGNVVFLKDVLDEAKHIMMQKQIQSPTTKVDITNLDDRIADILGISAVIVNDLKQRRQRDYDFSWDKALQVNGDTGIKLQYTHCRLCSLMENVTVNVAQEPIPELLSEPEAIQLIVEIAKFPDVLYKSTENFESCVLVNYLFSLSNSISRALKKLNVKNESSRDIQAQRMLLFETSKNILNNGMKILGLQPLIKM